MHYVLDMRANKVDQPHPHGTNKQVEYSVISVGMWLLLASGF